MQPAWKTGISSPHRYWDRIGAGLASFRAGASSAARKLFNEEPSLWAELFSAEQMEQRGAAPPAQGLQSGTTGSGRRRFSRSAARLRLHHCPYPPACDQGRQNNGPQAIGRARGELTTKIHAVIGALGNPLRLRLCASEIAYICEAAALILAASTQAVVADRGYDADGIKISTKFLLDTQHRLCQYLARVIP